MTENDRVLSALADEVNAAHAALSDLNVPLVLEGEPLSLPERIAWLNLTRPTSPASPPAAPPASERGMTDGNRPTAVLAAMSPVHVVALVKGVIEGEPIRHFGSLLGFDAHLAAARQLGLVTPGDGSHEVSATESGRRLYREAHLDALPDGRANHWGALADEAVARLRRMEAP
jgi:hypothetical protein